MKKVFSLLLAGGLVFGVSTIAKAQPPQGYVVPQYGQQARSPEETIRQFLSSGGLAFFTDLVETHQDTNIPRPDDPNGPKPEYDATIAASVGHFVLDAENIKTIQNIHNSNVVTASFTLDFHDPAMGFQMKQNDSVQLKRHFIHAGKTGVDNEYWSIIPGDPQKYFASNDNRRSGFTEKLATLVAYPGQIFPQIFLRRSEFQLKQLGAGLKMFVWDYDNRINLTQQNFKESLTPYVDSPDFFTAPGDSADTTSFNINPNIVGLPISAITDRKNTIAFYLGKNQKLDFRYDNLSPVCFMDGHVKAVTREEAKSLRWKP
jgi:hypothetical protein